VAHHLLLYTAIRDRNRYSSPIINTVASAYTKLRKSNIVLLHNMISSTRTYVMVGSLSPVVLL